MSASPQHVATNRKESLFSQTLLEHHDTIENAVAGKRILAIGAGGSIGSSTAATLAGYGPSALHIVDQNENALAEFVRQFWSMPVTPNISDFRTFPLDFGAPVTKHLLEHFEPYDLVLNFAAIKHVRSEKDPFSLLQMLDTNIVKQAQFLAWLGESSPHSRYFSVSTDKAANPVSFMGATKRIMEHVLFDPAFGGKHQGAITSARFANVAFSNGSLLQSFENRFARGEPLACPENIRRYFVSLEESGHICTLASLLTPSHHIAIPNLNPEQHLVPLRNVAEAFLRARGFEPAPYDRDEDAKEALPQDVSQKRWPLIITKADTAGEKPYEEFVAAGESSIDMGLGSIQAVPWAGLQNGGSIKTLVDRLSDLVRGRTPILEDKDQLKRLIADIEPAFLESHIDSEANLDQRA